MRIIFMGTPEFSLPSLRILLDNGYELAAVVTVPDKPAGRGQRVESSPVKDFAIQHNLPVLQPEKLGDPAFIASLGAITPELIVVVAFRILPPEVFMLPKYGAFNLHASILPRYRGAAPIQRSIMNGEKETGVTTFFLKQKVDTGNVILQARVPIGPEETAGELHDKLAEVGAEIVLHTVRLIEAGKANPVAQNDELATPAPKIMKEDCRIDWTLPAQQIHNLIRGLSPRPGAYTVFRDGIMKFYRSRIAGPERHGNPGEILSADGRLIVQAGTGAVEILELQQEGRKILTAKEFLRGFRFEKGEKFTS